MAPFAWPIFWRIAVRSFFSELTDKAFFLTMVLAAWDPLRGPRPLRAGGGASGMESLGVFLGVFSALAARAVVVGYGIHTWGNVFWTEVVSGSLLVSFAMKAIRDLQGLQMKDDGGADQESRRQLQAGQPPEYGSTPRKHFFTERFSKFQSWLSAFVWTKTLLTCAIYTVLVEVGDKSTEGLVLGAPAGREFVLGAILGLAPAVLLAMRVSRAFRQTFGDKEALQAAVCALLALAVVEVSQALQRVSLLRVPVVLPFS